MNKEILLEEINNKTDNIKDEKKKKVIKIILHNPNWYLDVNIDIFINILNDLGYCKQQSIEIYKFLLTN